MAICSDESKIKVAPSELFLGNRQLSCVTMVADVAGSLEDTYFTFGDADGDLFYVWFDSGTGTDPLVAGRTGIQVTYTANDTAQTIASLTKTAIEGEATADVNVKLEDDGTDYGLSLRALKLGSAEAATDGAVSTGFTFESLKTGSKQNLGSTTGGLEIAFDFASVDVIADQTGEQLQGQILTSTNVTVSTSTLEIDSSLYDKFLSENVGDKLTVGAEDIYGIGTSKLFSNLFNTAQELVIRPFNAADESDTITLWKTSVIPGTLSRSGSDLQSWEVEFSGYRDPAVQPEISVLAIGDVEDKVEIYV